MQLVCSKLVVSGEWVMPYTDVTYSVDNISLAEVADGRLVGKSVGTVTVTAVDNANTELTASTTFTVVETVDDTGDSANNGGSGGEGTNNGGSGGEGTVRLFAFGAGDAKEVKVGETLQIFVNKDGEFNYTDVTYSVDNTTYADISEDGILTGKTVGTVIITVTDKVEADLNATTTINVTE